jgi:subtilase family serine protease
MKNFRGFAALSLSAGVLVACGGSGGVFSQGLPVVPFALPWEAPGDIPYAAGVRIAPDFRDLGRARRSLQVRLSVMLRYQHQAELDALVEAQSDRGSPYFRRYLTNAQFNAYFAPSAQTYRRVAEVLTSGGLRIVHTFGNRTVVEAAGPSTAVERLFATRIDSGIQAGYGRRYMNVSDALMPASLRGLVATVTGLDNLESFGPRHRIVFGARAMPPTSQAPLRGPNGELGPLGFSRAYDEPNQHGYDGTGRAIANSYAGDINDNDLRHYLDYFQIKPAHRLRRITVDGGRLGRNDVETTLDIEAMIGTAPGAQVYMYSFGDFTEAGAVDVYNTIVDDNLVDAVNSSWGGCEYFKKTRLGHFYAMAANLIFEQGAAKGITFPIATGDFGWVTCTHDRTIDETTADDTPHALAVGGTTLNVDADGYWVSEKAWHGSAGGVSLVFPLPKYQSEIPNVVGGGRNLPDVAFDANPHVGFAERWHHIWVGAGGTSLGSPLWVGLEAQMDQYIGTRIGFVNPELYALEQGPSYGRVFHDITEGNNGGYRALPGYDLVTGIGSPIGWPLAQALK